ncbi:hypothetical protein BO70DRAFT_177763 [Aspergillus heteromorphus CBS 117.55]|uniref:Uncharacterized protein n=1 Tax=Aspergillus heteromorphus CBS 117.55 TaxID=1448321 RepID=A0A317WP55_9EURO|nr:uncharacterized protein BO70DRAFT_177763 [Aspergillus heteromorphus CBS 117.55]PWY88226.1 hypothetical protein BO70DRAFT_177763 [Aspergillus heteromorphus CBS 117.55]
MEGLLVLLHPALVLLPRVSVTCQSQSLSLSEPDNNNDLFNNILINRRRRRISLKKIRIKANLCKTAILNLGELLPLSQKANITRSYYLRTPRMPLSHIYTQVHPGGGGLYPCKYAYPDRADIIPYNLLLELY